MKINKTVAIVVILAGLLLGSLGAGIFLSRQPQRVDAAPPAQEENEAGQVDDVEDGDEPDEAGEAEEANVSPDETGITADQARAAAEASSGAKALAIELERENGIAIYEVELDNGLEVIVDAGNGDILGTETD